MHFIAQDRSLSLSVFRKYWVQQNNYFTTDVKLKQFKVSKQETHFKTF